jgi:DNA-binding NarL/FixJ family response regulator
MNHENPTVYVIICEKHESSIVGYKEMLSGLPYNFVFIIVKSEKEVYELLENSKAELVIFGVRKEARQCFEEIIKIKMKHEGKFMVITDNENPNMIGRMYDAGILGYIHDTHDGRTLRNKFELVMEGHHAYTGAAGEILKEKQKSKERGEESKTKKGLLNDDQQALLISKQDGDSDKESIVTCGYEEIRQVTNTMRAIFKISGTNDKTSAVKWAEDTGEIPRRGE